MRLEAAFKEFFEAIALGALPEGRISSAWERLQEYLVEHCGLSVDQVFLQGSYANDTAVKPATPEGEYDLDVVAVCARANATADDALNELESILAEDEDYKKRVERDKPKKPCIRLRYADDPSGRFHVDVTPARPATTASLEIPFRGEGWRETDPRGYTNWCKAEGEQFLRTVRMLKRWRDVNEDERRGIKSIVLQVLTAQALPPAGSDADALLGSLRGIQGRLADYPSAPPSLLNPVLPSEDLTSRWPDGHYRLFCRNIDEAVELAQAALWEHDEAESHRLWSELLGDDFPPAPSSPAKRARIPPATPPPGYEKTPQEAPRRERYG